MSKHAPNKKTKYYSGNFIPQNPDKYIGDETDIIYRSKWEYSFCVFCDNESSILKWESEPPRHSIPYEVYENGKYSTKKYIPDFWLQIKKGNDIDEMIIEVKPYKETIEPIEPKKKSIKSLNNYEYSLKSYIKNQLKWDAATKYCSRRSMDFFVLNEKYFENKEIKLF